jgi:uncharacterized protein
MRFAALRHCAKPKRVQQEAVDRNIYCGYNKSMRLTYDPAKSLRNEKERGLPFDLAERFDWSSALVVEDTRENYPERRYQAMGFIEEHLHMLVFTPRDGAVHVISLRRANQRERNRYATQTES